MPSVRVQFFSSAETACRQYGTTRARRELASSQSSTVLGNLRGGLKPWAAAVAVFAAAGGEEQLSGECVGGWGVEGAIARQVALSLSCVSSR